MMLRSVVSVSRLIEAVLLSKRVTDVGLAYSFLPLFDELVTRSDLMWKQIVTAGDRFVLLDAFIDWRALQRHG